MEVSSEFSNNEKIPARYTCDGEGMIPPLTVSNIPSHAKTLVVIVDDPDAPSKTWVHWIIFDIPVSSSEMEINNSLGREGTNDFSKIGYDGPCPSSGIYQGGTRTSSRHHYYFRVYALGDELGLSRGATREEVEAGMKDKILEETELIGLYEKN